MATAKPKYIAWFRDLTHEDIPIAGGKGANLGEMYRLGIPVPNGFVVTSQAYFDFIQSGNLSRQIKTSLDNCDVNDPVSLQSTSHKIQTLIRSYPISDQLAQDIMKAYLKLSGWLGIKHVPVAVRSSATAEDLPDASFAGQQETFLNVVGESNVVKRVQDCWASLFTPRAIFYRHKQHYDHLKVGIAVPVQKLINSQISGIIFTVNPVNQDKNQIVIECIWGLGEYIVQGKVTPERHLVDKTTWQVIESQQVTQRIQLIRDKDETRQDNVPVSKETHAKLNPDEVIKISKLAQKIHNHYSKPQDLEFAIDKDRNLYIVQSRPITTLNSKIITKSTKYLLPPILSGQPASPGIGTGKVVILKSPKEINKAKMGDILVTKMTSPDFVPAMKRVAAIITDEGGQTSHAAIVSRELGVPCIVGTQAATNLLKDGQIVTVDANLGQVFPSDILPEKKITSTTPKISKIKTATKLYVNLGEPDLAKAISKRDVDGIGLLRAEFMMANIGIHPKHMIQSGQRDLFVNKLTNNLLKFARAFNPRPIIYRATDFKSNEYKHLKWGSLYEPEEPNPLLGFRGAIRYIHTPDVFLMELEAIKKVRNKWGLKNLHLMIPFVRTPQELIQVKKILADAGLLRSPSFRLYMMVEIPSNVILLEEFIKVGIDGVSIGSNDLTMLTLGMDRDNAEISKEFNELDPAVLWCLEKTIKTAKKTGITCSICGQAPSNHPDLLEKLVEWGITAISVSPDALTRSRQLIHWAEAKKIGAKI